MTNEFNILLSRRAVTTPHNFFGLMELDEQQRTYRAVLDFSPGHKVSIIINWAGISPAEALKRAQEIWTQVCVRESQYRAKIAEALLPQYNNRWCNGNKLDTNRFMDRISLSNAEITPADLGSESCVCLGYSDGGLFTGHYIEVFLDADFNYLNSQICG